MNPTTPLPEAPTATKHHGPYVTLDGHDLYRIDDMDRIDPFLMNVVCDGDLWMYASSAGGVTCGRTDAHHAALPYDTVDRLHHNNGVSGPVTVLRVQTAGGQTVLWQPLSDLSPDDDITRNLYKSVEGPGWCLKKRIMGWG